MKLKVYDPVQGCVDIYEYNEYSESSTHTFSCLTNALYTAVKYQYPFYIEIKHIFTSDTAMILHDRAICGNNDKYEKQHPEEFAEFYRMIDELNFSPELELYDEEDFKDLALNLADTFYSLYQSIYEAFDVYVQDNYAYEVEEDYQTCPNISDYFNNWYVFCGADEKFYKPKEMNKFYPILIETAKENIYKDKEDY